MGMSLRHIWVKMVMRFGSDARDEAQAIELFDTIERDIEASRTPREHDYSD